MHFPLHLLSFVSSIAWVPLTLSRASSPDCRCFPGDSCWPTDGVWNQFNVSVGGRLIRTVPIGHVCHDPTYNAEACEALRAVWTDTPTHIETTHSPMVRQYTNDNCDPFADRAVPCRIGTYVQYAVNVSTIDEITKTLKFAQEKNIRLVIRNTGHDYLGKSTGAGAVALWTHNMKNIELKDWNSKHYTGKALKVGAGVFSGEAVAFAAQHGLTVASGNCPTVGIAGGYIQGGGHGPLASKYGLAVDHTLEFEVVDASGRYMIANQEENPDMYWALSGGGGGTYGVVVSMTMRTVPDEVISNAILEFGSAGLKTDKYWDVIAQFIVGAHRYSDAGCWFIFGFTNDGFGLQPMNCPGMTTEQITELLNPFTNILDDAGIQYKKEVTTVPTYSEYYRTVLGVWEKGQAGTITGGMWMVPPSAVSDYAGAKAYVEASRKISDSGAFMYHLTMNVREKFSGVFNAIRPEYRNVFIQTGVVLPLSPQMNISALSEAQRKVTEELMPQIQALAPESGSYLNEADPNDPNWKKNFYGGYYDQLLDIKNKYDPEHLFHARTAVGSDYWVERKDGRLCPATSEKHVKDEL